MHAAQSEHLSEFGTVFPQKGLHQKNEVYFYDSSGWQRYMWWCTGYSKETEWSQLIKNAIFLMLLDCRAEPHRAQ